MPTCCTPTWWRAISTETLRRILREGGVTWQSTKTWKASTDPDFTSKLAAVLDLYDRPGWGQWHTEAREWRTNRRPWLRLAP
ncbi:hypothetical protein GCM10009681_19380 [Luedemannella helvata]|uniref:Uncharacterized protein n=1 Tax=Luedemannella helvata TaxID=349315 RepID=A0ABN3II07_9ACTN